MVARSDAEVMLSSVEAPRQFAFIFDRHLDAVHRFVAYRVRSSDVDDNVAEVFRIAFEKRAAFDQGAVSAKPWLLGIASNLTRRHHRSADRGHRALQRTANRHLSPIDPLIAVDARLDAAASVGDLWLVIEQLPDGEREVLLMTVWDELAPSEIAAALGIPAATVRTRLHRARNTLRRTLSDAAVDGEVGADAERAGGGDR